MRLAPLLLLLLPLALVLVQLLLRWGLQRRTDQRRDGHLAQDARDSAGVAPGGGGSMSIVPRSSTVRLLQKLPLITSSSIRRPWTYSTRRKWGKTQSLRP